MLAILVPSDLEAQILTDLPGEAVDLGGFSGQRGQLYLALICGVGAANAAAAVGFLVGRFRVDRILLVGIAGAYPGSGLGLGDLAVAAEEVYADLDGMMDLGFPSLVAGGQVYYNNFPAGAWARQLAGAIGAPQMKFLTQDRVSNSELEAAGLARRYGVAMENMEGAGAALAALRLGLEWAEIRSVSNPAGRRDRAHWDIARALGALRKAIGEILALE